MSSFHSPGTQGWDYGDYHNQTSYRKRQADRSGNQIGYDADGYPIGYTGNGYDSYAYNAKNWNNPNTGPNGQYPYRPFAGPKQSRDDSFDPQYSEDNRDMVAEKAWRKLQRQKKREMKQQNSVRDQIEADRRRAMIESGQMDRPNVDQDPRRREEDSERDYNRKNMGNREPRQAPNVNEQDAQNDEETNASWRGGYRGYGGYRGGYYGGGGVGLGLGLGLGVGLGAGAYGPYGYGYPPPYYY